MMKPNPAKLNVKKQISRPEILFGIARRPGSGEVFAGASSGDVIQLDTASDKPEAKLHGGHDSYVSSVVWGRDSIISGGFDGRMIWRDAKTGQATRAIEAHSKWIRMVFATPDESKILSVADDMVCRVWDSTSGKLIRELKGHDERTPNHFPSMLYAVTCSPDNQHVATADKVGNIFVWELSTGKRVASLQAPKMYTWDPKARIHSIGGIRSLAFSPDGVQLAAGGIGQIGNIDHLGALARIEIFDWAKNERLHEFPGDTFKGLVERLQYSPSGEFLLAAGGDHSGFIKAINLGDGKIIKQEKAPAHIHDFVVSESFDTIYAAAHNKIVVWEMPLA